MVAGVDVLDLGGRSPSVRPASAGIAGEALRSAAVNEAHLQQDQPAGRAAAGADRRAHAARRARGELLVSPPPRRLRVDRRAGAPACASPTSPAARATAPTCSRAAAAEVVGVDANPEAHEHARLRYRRPNLRFERGLVEDFDEAVRRDRLPADDRARRASPADLLERFARGAPRSATSRPRTGSRSRPPGRRSPTTRGTCASTPRPSTARCSSRASRGSSSTASFTPASCALHELAIRAGWDRVHPALRITKPFYDRFVPAIAAARLRDPARAAVRPRPGARLPRRLPARERRLGGATWRSSFTATCPTSRASAPTRSARSGCSTP